MEERQVGYQALNYCIHLEVSASRMTSRGITRRIELILKTDVKVKSFAGFARFTPKSTPIALRGHDDRYKTIGSNSHVSANWPIRTSRYRTIARINRVINRGRNSANVTHCKCDVRGRKHILRNEILQSRGAARGIGCAPLTLLPV